MSASSRETKEAKYFDEWKLQFTAPGKPLSEEMEKFLSNASKIYVLLLDQERCDSHLKTINALIESKLKDTPNNDLKVNLLRQVIEDKLVPLGFHPFAKVTRSLLPEKFLELIERGYLIKDVFVGNAADHGEFSHALQWLIIALEQEVNPQFLTQDIISLYKMFGSKQSMFPDNPQALSNYSGPLWDLVFEQRKGMKGYTSAASFIENMVYQYGDKIEGVDHLSTIIHSRLSKRGLFQEPPDNKERNKLKYDEEEPGIFIPKQKK